MAVTYQKNFRDESENMTSDDADGTNHSQLQTENVEFANPIVLLFIGKKC